MTKTFFDIMKERIDNDEVRMIDVDGVSYYSATDIDALFKEMDLR